MKIGKLIALFFILYLVPCNSQEEPTAQKDTMLVIERKVKIRSMDTLKNFREILRDETVKIKKDMISIKDETFQTALIIRLDKKLVWTIDLIGKTYQERDFQSIIEEKKNVSEELKQIAERVKGSPDEKEIKDVVSALGGYEIEEISVSKKDKIMVKVNKKEGHKSIALLAKTFEPDRYSEIYFEALSAIGGIDKKLADELKKQAGIPEKGFFWYTLFLDAETEEVIETYSYQEKEAESADFELPEGFKKTEPQKLFDINPPEPRLNEGFDEDELERRQILQQE